MEVGTLAIWEDDGARCVRWTVEDFLLLVKTKSVLDSDIFRFGPCNFFMSVLVYRASSGYETDYAEANLVVPYGILPPGGLSWTLSVVDSDDKIFMKTESEQKASRRKPSPCKLDPNSTKLNLGPLRDIGRFLHCSDGALVLLCELRRIPEGTADVPSSSPATSPLKLNPVQKKIFDLNLQFLSSSWESDAGATVGDVKVSAQPVENRSDADGADNSGQAEPVEGKLDANLSTRTFGTLRQQVVLCTKNTWTMPNFRKHAERETCLYSERFYFGSRRWQMRLSPRSGQSESGREGDVLLSLQDVSECETSCPFSCKLSTVDERGAILESSEGSCEEANIRRVVTLKLGPLRDAQKFLDSDGVLRVTCELHLTKETTEVSSQTKPEAGAELLARDYERILSSGEATDVTVRVKGEREFLLHRAILVARTPVLASMLQQKMSESETDVVDIEDCDPDTFRRFLHFIYTGGAEDLLPEDATELYRVAAKYQVDELKSHCLECIRGGGLTIESFCPTISLALQHCERELTEQVTDFFADNMDDIMLTVQWQEFLCNNPLQANELIVKALRKKNAQLKQTSSS